MRRPAGGSIGAPKVCDDGDQCAVDVCNVTLGPRLDSRS
jgi:hypothetical protein